MNKIKIILCLVLLFVGIVTIFPITIEGNKEEIQKVVKEKTIKFVNAIKYKFKTTRDNEQAYTIMYFRDLSVRHNIGFGFEYTNALKRDKQAFLIEYTYKF